MNQTKKAVCPYCQKSDNVKANGTTAGKKQKYFCKSCNKSFVIDTQSANEWREKQKELSKADMLACPKCNSKESVIKHTIAIRKHNNSEVEIQRYRCTKCPKTFNADYIEKKEKKEKEEYRLLNGYLCFVDNINRNVEVYIDPWFVGKIAEYLGVKKHVLNRVINKNYEIVQEHWERRKERLNERCNLSEIQQPRATRGIN